MNSNNSDVVNPVEMVAILGDKGKAKVNTTSLQLINSGITAGVMAAMGTILMIKAASDDQLPGGAFIGGLLLPVAFVFISLTGSDLFTANIITTTMAMLSRKIRPVDVARPWACLLLGNFLGGLFTGLVYFLIHSNLGLGDCADAAFLSTNPEARGLCKLARIKVYTYTHEGDPSFRGWFVCFLKAVVVNWLVCLATVLANASYHTIARIVGLWLPAMLFAIVGYEHIVVNFFVLPTAWMFQAPDVSVGNSILLNLMPSLLGNIVGGLLLSVQLYFNHGERIKRNDDEEEKTISSMSKIMENA